MSKLEVVITFNIFEMLPKLVFLQLLDVALSEFFIEDSLVDKMLETAIVWKTLEVSDDVVEDVADRKGLLVEWEIDLVGIQDHAVEWLQCLMIRHMGYLQGP